MSAPNWLNWAQRLESIAATGLHYGPQPFDRDRYEMVRQIAAEMLAAAEAGSVDELVRVFGESRGHATPKIDVRGVVFCDGKILMVQEMLDNAR